MTAPAPLTPSMAAALAALCVGSDPLATPQAVRPGTALVQLRKGGALVLLVDAPLLTDADTRARLAEALGGFSLPMMHVLAVGSGDDADLRDLREHVPRPTLLLTRLEDDGAVRGLTRTALPTATRMALQGALPATLDPAAVEAVGAALATAGEARREDHRAFLDRITRRRPVVTTALAIALVAIGIAQASTHAWDGGSEIVVRWGATFGGALTVAPWTVLSSGLVHGGVVHLAMNTYVLWLIGGQLERIVGGGRVLALFTAGVLGGGLAVALVPGTPLTWGASGGIWALLVAQGWLGFFPRGLIPEPVAAGVKRAARTNLIINVLISLAPGISGLGHLGGGIGGLVLAAAGAMHRGIAVDEDATVAPRHPLQLVPLVACGLLLVGAFAVAMAVGQPWAGAVL